MKEDVLQSMLDEAVKSLLGTTRPYQGLIVGTDPLAVDAVGAHLPQSKQIAFFGEDRPLDVPPAHILVADETHHLGVSGLSGIQLIKLG